jgi:hypothetical protein
MVYDNFTFICAKTIKDRKYWVCGKQRSKNCKARLISECTTGELFFAKIIVHNHEREPIKVDEKFKVNK